MSNQNVVDYYQWRRDPFFTAKFNDWRISSTPLNSDEETWNSLRGHTSNLQTKYIFQCHGHYASAVSKKKRQLFQGYIDQAENFYLSSKTLNIRSRPLILYYCYLNLAKALLLISSNSQPVEDHGFKAPIDTGPNSGYFNNQKVKFKNYGVAVSLFKFFDFNPEHSEINLLQAFPFIPEISNQFLKTSYSYSRMSELAFIPCKVGRFKSMDNQSGFRNVIALYYLPDNSKKIKDLMPNIKRFKNYFSDFFNEYEEITVATNSNIARVFNVTAEDIDKFLFFQSRKNNFSSFTEMNQHLVNVFGNTVQESVVNDGSDFYVYVPKNNKNPLVLNEFLAIYLATFYFSNVVRYNPYYMGLFETREDNWLFESLFEVVHLKMLRYFHGYITRDLEILRKY